MATCHPPPSHFLPLSAAAVTVVAVVSTAFAAPVIAAAVVAPVFDAAATAVSATAAASPPAVVATSVVVISVLVAATAALHLVSTGVPLIHEGHPVEEEEGPPLFVPPLHHILPPTGTLGGVWLDLSDLTASSDVVDCWIGGAGFLLEQAFD